MTAAKTHSDIPAEAVMELDEEPQPDAAALADAQTKAGLVAEAEARGLPTDGTKAELAERIAGDAARPENEPFFAGWYVEGVPVFGCPHCLFTFTDATDVMWHIHQRHPDVGGNES